MNRREQVEALAAVLQLAAAKASLIAPKDQGTTREAALAKQLEGIAMEYRAIAAGLPTPERMRDPSWNADGAGRRTT